MAQRVSAGEGEGETEIQRFLFYCLLSPRLAPWAIPLCGIGPAGLRGENGSGSRFIRPIQKVGEVTGAEAAGV